MFWNKKELELIEQMKQELEKLREDLQYAKDEADIARTNMNTYREALDHMRAEFDLTKERFRQYQKDHPPEQPVVNKKGEAEEWAKLLSWMGEKRQNDD